ncbi:DUF6850 family outer membrane beta-barrel protein [Pedobacter jejuensis]|uniref:DUF6850 domain-containing protein n=1 Tax=Pedobacter jejuensis TaxID=1268550 RepID=A0A3N0BPQ1_9SPHI|nr:DUF6850 family outer membrane beta-barrel protein [Pedobacter jejuensis]RNL50989.1 hypothetical protein D7004_14765 [Pedobacter jejuensis]
MKKLSLLIIFQCLCLFCYSQSNNENANQSLSNKVFNADSVSKNAFEFAKLSPFNIRKLIPLQYSNISVGFNYDKGELMEAQNAGKIKNTYIKTEGSTQLGSIFLYGLFSYHKTFEDSTMYNHQTRNNVSTPYYFGSPINVSYERAVYNLSALAEKNLLDKNLPIGLGADYRIGNHFSTNDPRGSVSDFQFNLIGTLGYTFFNRLKIGTAYRYGYGQERFSVDYKNNSYSQIVLLPAYNNYLINGYGEAYIKNLERDYNNDEIRNGFDAYINFESGNFGNLYFLYSHIAENQNYLRSNSSGRFNFNRYHLDKNSFNLLWLKNFRNKKLSINLNYNNSKGKDLNYIYLANNYLYNTEQIGLRNILTMQKNATRFNYTLAVNKSGEQRKDGLTGNDVEYNKLDLVGGMGFNKTFAKEKNWGIDINAIYSLPLNSSINVPEINVGQFTQRVIYYDYMFNTSTKIGGNLSADYSFPAFNQIQAGIKVGLTYLERIKMPDTNYIYLPGKDRFSSNISLNLYF